MSSTRKVESVALVFSGGFCGGAEVLMIKLHQLYEAKGIKTTLLLAGTGVVSERFKEQAKLIKPPELFDKFKPWIYGKSLLCAMKELRASQAKLVIIEGKALTQVYVIAARILGIPAVSYVHFPPSDYEVRRIPYKMATRVVLCTEGISSYFAQKKLSKLTAIPNFVNSEHFAPSVSEEQRTVLRESIFRLAPGDTETLCLSLIGHLSEVKGQAVLLKAAAKLKEKGVHFKICFAGIDNSKDKKHEKKLRALQRELDLEHEVIFQGRKEKTLDIYQGSDIFALPSFREGLPLVVLEAMACGLPVIASRIDGNLEAIEDGIHGRLISCGDSDELAATIFELKQDRVQRDRLGLAARKRVLTHFTEPRWQESFIELYHQLAT